MAIERQYGRTGPVTFVRNLTFPLAQYDVEHHAPVEMDQSTKQLIFVADPLAWSAVGSWLLQKAGEAAIGAVASTVISSIFGDEIDFDIFLRNLIKEFEIILRREIQENELRKLDADLDSLQVSMRRYVISPITFSDERLRMLDSATKLYSHGKSFNELGIGLMAMSKMISTVILIDLYHENKRKEDIEVAKLEINEFLAILPELQAKLEQGQSNRVSGMHRKHYPEQRGHREGAGFDSEAYDDYWFYVDGSKSKIYTNRAREAYQARASHIKRLVENANKEIMVPAFELGDAMLKLVNDAESHLMASS